MSGFRALVLYYVYYVSRTTHDVVIARLGLGLQNKSSPCRRRSQNEPPILNRARGIAPIHTLVIAIGPN
jgi:hypothetical protein